MHGYRIYRLGMCVLGLLIAHSAHGQSGGMLSGTIADEQSLTPVDGATVLAAGTLAGAITNVHGRFTLGPLSAGEYTLLITATGYEQLSHDVRIESDTTVIVELVLRLAYPELPIFSPLVGAAPTSGFPATALSSELWQIPGIMPLRASSLELLSSVRGLPQYAAAAYIDGVRMLEVPGVRLSSLTLMQSSSVDRILMAGGPYGIFWGPGARGGLYITRKRSVMPAVEMAYDSRLGGFRTHAVYSKSMSNAYGELSGSYARAGAYTDGQGDLQSGSPRAAGLQARGHIGLGSGHMLEGRSSLETHDVDRIDEVTKNAQAVGYIYVRKRGWLEGAALRLSRQQWTGFAEADQESGRFTIRLRPGLAWRVHAGLEFIRQSTAQLQESSVFARLTRGGGRVRFMVTGRADRISIDGRPDHGWHVQTSVDWRTSPTTRLLMGMGRWAAFSGLGIPQISQVDLGLSVNRPRARAMTRIWVRRLETYHVTGMDMYLAAPILSDHVEIIVTATAMDHADYPPIRGGIGAVWDAPAEFLRLGARMAASASTKMTDAWFTSDVWMQVAGISRAALCITAKNLFDQTYAWSASNVSFVFPEPGRSFGFALQYGI